MNSTRPHDSTASLHEALVRAAVLAPTPDNNQPWLFQSEGDSLQVLLDRSRSLPSDVNGMFDLLGIGGAIENICIAARERGLTATVQLADSISPSREPDPFQPIATLAFQPGGTPDPLFAHLESRCTNRKLYSKNTPADTCLKRIAGATDAFENVQVDWICERALINDMARLVAATDLIRFQYEPFHQELFRQLRFSREEAERTRDGLDLRTLELPPGVGLALRVLRSWSVMNTLHRLGLGSLLTIPSATAIRRSGALAAISVATGTQSAFIEGGRAFQRLWLQADREGLALQPLGSPSIFFAHLKVLEGAKLSTRHQTKIRALIERFDQLAPSTAGRHLVMLVRIGTATAPSCRSLRREPRDVFRQGASTQEGVPQ